MERRVIGKYLAARLALPAADPGADGSHPAADDDAKRAPTAVMTPEPLSVPAAVRASLSVRRVLSGLDFFGMGLDLFFDRRQLGHPYVEVGGRSAVAAACPPFSLRRAGKWNSGPHLDTRRDGGGVLKMRDAGRDLKRGCPGGGNNRQPRRPDMRFR